MLSGRWLRPGELRPGERGRGERGSALIEMALVLPLLLVLALNVGDAGWALAQQNTVRAAAREAARVAATQGLAGVDELAELVCPGITRVEPEMVTITLASPAEGSGTVSVTSGYTPITDSPVSLFRSVDEIGATLRFRIDPANDPPAWLPGGTVGCDEV